jgi:TRAP-type uncharacterized transport system substrate-binding protein
MRITAVQSPNRIAGRPADWRGKGLIRILLLIGVVIAIAGLASIFGVFRDYAYLRASLLAGNPTGTYHALATRLAARARRGHGSVVVVPTAGSVENVSRLAEGRGRCAATFAFVQDGIPVPADAQLEVLGRLPESESLLLFGRRDRAFSTFADLRGASIGIGPEGSGSAYLMRQLFEDPDLADLDVRLSQHGLAEQTELVAQGRLDLAAVVMGEDAEFIRTALRQYDLDIAAPRELEGLVKRHPWLGLGSIPAGRYDLERPTPSVDKRVAQVDTLVVAGSCARRAERVALLTLLSAELPGFVRGNPPRSTGSATALPIAPEAREFFVTGEPEIADRYFPWLVNLMSPAYWVYLVMAVTVLFNAMRGFSRFRLWRIDSAREKLKAHLKQLTGPDLAGEQMRADRPQQVPAEPGACTTDILNQLMELRARCQRYTGSVVTPMGDEMFYRYQESLIDELTAKLAAIPTLAPAGETGGRMSDGQESSLSPNGGFSPSLPAESQSAR